MSPSSGGGTAPPQLNASDVSTGQWAEPTASSVPLAVVVNSGVTKAATAESSSSTSQPVKIDKHDKRSLAYVWRSLVAGGVAGCVAKTVIAPLDRVKILFQTNNPKFQRHSGAFAQLPVDGVSHQNELPVTSLSFVFQVHFGVFSRQRKKFTGNTACVVFSKVTLPLYSVSFLTLPSSLWRLSNINWCVPEFMACRKRVGGELMVATLYRF